MTSAGILKKIKKDYGKIAAEFDKTRERAWPEFLEFLKFMPDEVATCGRVGSAASLRSGMSGKILDIGCGNGRLVSFFKSNSVRNIDYTGVDNNRALLAIARKKHPDFKFRYGDILNLPFPAKFFKNIWCIAVLHHLPTARLRIAAAKELKRALKKDGVLMLTVWNLWQPKYKKYINPKTRDALIPWGKAKNVKRYYHAFKNAELTDLLKRAGFCKVKKIKSKHNIAFVCRLLSVKTHEKS